jgi:hypothetical protein
MAGVESVRSEGRECWHCGEVDDGPRTLTDLKTPNADECPRVNSLTQVIGTCALAKAGHVEEAGGHCKGDGRPHENVKSGG